MIRAALTRSRRKLLRWLRHKPTAASYIDVERAEQGFYLQYLRKGMTVFDVGANIGELTLLFSRFVDATGWVHAFEPSEATFARLTAVCRATARRNVVLNRLALADRSGTFELQAYPDEHSGWNSLARRPLYEYGVDVSPAQTEKIEATTVDAYCETQRIAQIDLLKIDVEGAEYQVLLGARGMLRARRIRCCTFEFGQTTFDMGNDPDELEAYLAGMGYRVRNIVKGDPVFPGRGSVATARFSMHVAAPAS